MQVYSSLGTAFWSSGSSLPKRMTFCVVSKWKYGHMKDQEECCKVTVISSSTNTVLIIALEGVHEVVKSWTVYIFSGTCESTESDRGRDREAKARAAKQQDSKVNVFLL